MGYRVNTAPDPLWGTFSAFDWVPDAGERAEKDSMKRGEKRATWHVLWWTRSSMRLAYNQQGIYSAGIEAFEEGSGRTRVVFLDGYDPKQPLLPRPRIGAAFEEFSDWIIDEITEQKRKDVNGPLSQTEPDAKEIAELRQWFADKTASVRERESSEATQTAGTTVRQDREWDVFISYASEDREEIARPLAERLKAEGLRVWFDEFELKVGDSLRRSIDLGLSRSSCGVVIISHSFFAKEWPQRELDGLVARATAHPGGRLILPVWHGVGSEEVRKYSPTLADLVAVRTDDGLDYVVSQLLEAICMRPATGTSDASRVASQERRLPTSEATQPEHRRTVIADRFDEIADLPPQRRGLEFQKLFAELVEQQGWAHEESVRTSHEEMDVVINQKHEYYIVECKWWRRPVSAAVIRELYGKLRGRALTNGIVVSMSGFSSGAVEQSREYASDRVILLFGPEDVGALVHDQVLLTDMLDEKYDALVKRREVTYQ
jgi:hypothetical protein